MSHNMLCAFLACIHTHDHAKHDMSLEASMKLGVLLVTSNFCTSVQ